MGSGFFFKTSLFLLFLSWKSYKLRQKIITWRNKTGRFPRHLKLTSCLAQDIPCPRLYWLSQSFPPLSPHLTCDVTFGCVCHWGILLYKIAGSLRPDLFEKHLLFANLSLFHFSFLGHLIRILLSRHAAAVCGAAGLFNCIDSTGLPHHLLQPVLHSSGSRSLLSSVFLGRRISSWKSSKSIPLKPEGCTSPLFQIQAVVVKDLPFLGQ